jgi:hypothetical protein
MYCGLYVAMAFAGIIPLQSPAATLGEALDNTNLVWTTCTSNALERPWFVETAVDANAHDGVDNACSGSRNAHGNISWLETEIVGPGTLTYWCRVSSEVPTVIVIGEDEPMVIYHDYLTMTINGEEVDLVSGPCGNWIFKSFSLPAGTNVVRWSYVKDGGVTDECGVDQVRLDEVQFEPDPFLLAEGLGTCGWEWQTGGESAGWAGQEAVTVDGKAVRSGHANSDQESWMSVTVWGVSEVSFLWQVSSRTNADYLEFYTNSYVHDPMFPPEHYAARISGEVTTWQSNYFQLSAGDTHTLTWRYVKSSESAFGQNRGWVDQVRFNPDPLRTPYELVSPNRQPDGSFTFALLGQTNCPCRVEVSTNMFDWITLQDLFITDTVTPIADPGAAGSDQRFYRANTQ